MTGMSLLVLAAEKSPWSGITRVVGTLGQYVLAAAPVLLALAWLWGALLWVSAGHDTGKVDKARAQIKRCLIATAIIGGYFAVRGLFLGLSIGGF